MQQTSGNGPVATTLAATHQQPATHRQPISQVCPVLSDWCKVELLETLSDFAKGATLQVIRVEVAGDEVRVILHDGQFVLEATLNSSYRSMIPYLKPNCLVKLLLTSGGVQNLHIVGLHICISASFLLFLGEAAFGV